MTRIVFLVLIVYLSSSTCRLNNSNVLFGDNRKYNIEQDTLIYTNGFDFPVGKPDGLGYYKAQKFTENNHLGEDWNGLRGGNSDLGNSIYGIANGYVNFANDLKGGWGKVIRITHYLPDGQIVESLYAHCDKIIIKSNTWIKKGDLIGTIGTAHNQYLAHLHFEIRDTPNLSLGAGYSRLTKGYLNPTSFINTHRKVLE